MTWLVPDRTSGLLYRPYKREEEIDRECEAFLRNFLQLPTEVSLPVPLSTDLLTNAIEAYAERLDLYADMETEIEGLTEISTHSAPFVSINRLLSTAYRSQNRLRSTLAHEFYHLYFHAPLYRERLKQLDLFAGPPQNITCRRETILQGKSVDWREWQAAYGAGALLMPISALREVLHEQCETYGPPPYVANSGMASSAVALVASRFAVSQEAATVRLWQKGFLRRLADGRQLDLLGGEEMPTLRTDA
jgi:Zn-dependent peptidase ImmA (M78 family)